MNTHLWQGPFGDVANTGDHLKLNSRPTDWLGRCQSQKTRDLSGDLSLGTLAKLKQRFHLGRFSLKIVF